VEASPRGEPVTIRVVRAGAVRVAIHNSGVVPLSIRDRFFEKYVTHGKKNGTGLGTYSAKLLAEVQGWSISMRTAEGTGTFLTVAIPD
jgi:signal transduction histidine kinase